ncbi:MAG TPA: hypothetical protein VM010_02015 [Chitinophagaceae bacterium]|nr:hypothetical protein [Chitinophagaceae bacterium]
MTKTTPFLCLLLFSFSAPAQTSLTDGASLLFKNVATKLTDAEKTAVFQSLAFLPSADKKQFIMDATAADYPFDAQVFPADLNKDGTEEIFVVYGNTYTSGNTGSSVVLFIKNAGAYKANLNFPGVTPDALATANQGYPDLLIGGPGMQFPVWRWNGKEYAYLKEMKNAEYGKLKKTSIEALSKAYTTQLPK